MKLLTALVLVLFSVVAEARSGDTPIFPWPTSVDRKALFLEDLQGDWVAYGHNAVWHIHIEATDMEPERAEIQISSAALFTRKASGWLLAADRIYYGKIKMDEKHEAALVIFKDQEGTKVRLSRSQGRFLDLKLFLAK